ncbi:heavy-metal-associated domain-containing protein [Maliponia aquimaris]|uniref:Mercuric transport protein periplasmic component n=1 Tax=Maliponia aquimaris TaxID=1673631 RepID=A0A238KT11_9RHOB|nr:heavy-metal-associated domain-containing protein [Maliponia aquimaris]SMX45847.1 Mercuric transport protein periplasmic component precursor [Maliponia aquimaris]
MKKIITTAMFSALFGLAPVAPITTIPAAAQTVAAEQTVTFTIDNMTCALCPVTVKRAMEGVGGVRSVEIDFEARTATVVFDPATTGAEAIAAASASAGYPARVAG